jgi:DNA-binding MarR family transcriptional regulator
MNLESLGVTYSQTIFLVRLWERDGQTQMELTKSAGLKQPTVVGILDKMERDGLLIRARSTEDKRCTHFYLTEKAKTACRELEKQGEFMQNLATERLGQADVDSLNHNLIAVIENLALFIEKMKV